MVALVMRDIEVQPICKARCDILAGRDHFARHRDRCHGIHPRREFAETGPVAAMTSLTEPVLTAFPLVASAMSAGGDGLQRPSSRELPVRHLLHQAMELCASHVHEGAVIATFEVDVLVPLQARVNDCRETIGSSDGGNRSVLTVREESTRFFLRGQGDGPFEPAPDLIQPHLA
jgi:hypothetical protein